LMTLLDFGKLNIYLSNVYAQRYQYMTSVLSILSMHVFLLYMLVTPMLAAVYIYGVLRMLMKGCQWDAGNAFKKDAIEYDYTIKHNTNNPMRGTEQSDDISMYKNKSFDEWANEINDRDNVQMSYIGKNKWGIESRKSTAMGSV
jgi:hypothetical protein